MNKFIASILGALFYASAALGQTSPNLHQGQVLTPAQWNALFIGKQDTLGYVPLNIAGGIMTGRLVTVAPGATLAGFNLVPGTTPSTPVNGDLWVTSSSIFARINGVNVDLVGAACLNCALTNVANTFTAMQIVNLNGTSAPAAQTGSLWQLNQANGVIGRLEVDTYAATTILTGVRANGTAASPTALALNDEILSLNAWGYDGSTRSGPAAAVRLFSGATWTTTNHGTYIDLATTSVADATKTLTSRMRIENDGAVKLTTSLAIAGCTIGSNTICSTGPVSLAGATSIGSTAVNAFYVTATIGSTSPSAFNVDASTASLTTGINIKGAVSGGTAALSVIDGGGANANLSIDAKGTGGITLGGVSTGNVAVLSPFLIGGSGINGSLNLQNSTSGNISVTTPAGALGSRIQTLQAVSDTFVYRATTDTLTNKGIDCSNNTCSHVPLATALGNLATGNLNSGSGASSGTFWRGDGSWGVPSGTGANTGGIEATTFNASGSPLQTTGTISAASSTLTLASALDFINGEGIRINHAGATFAVNAPTSLIVTPTGTTGATQYVYTIAPLDASGGVGSAIANTTTNTGNATLSNTNFNALTWTAPGSGPAPWGYAVYAACPAGCSAHTASLTLVAVVQTNSFNDVGFGLITPNPDWIPSAPQGPSLADWLVTSVSSGGGTTTLTLANAATTAATTQLVDHDDTVALQTCITTASNAHTRCHLSGLSGISFPTSSLLFITGRMELYGDGIQGTQNYNYANQGSGWLTRASASNATMIFPNITHGGISATLNDALNIHDFGIFYTSQTPTLGGTTGLFISGTAGAYTITQTGTLNGTTTITGLTDTRYMHVQQGLFGTNIPAGATVTSIDSATQIHISNAATGSGATSLTFDVITGDTLNGSVTNGSTSVTGMTNANFLVPGEVITSSTNPSCIPFGTIVNSSTSTTVTMSKAATCTNGALPLTFTFGLMTNLRVRGMLIGGADRGMFLGAMTEFWVEQNKFYDNTSYSTILDLNNGNGDWQYGPGNINISGSIFPMSHIWLSSGGGGRIIANKFNTAGSVNSGSTQGIDFNPVRPFTSIEPPTINDNSIEGLNTGIRFFNSCTPTITCQASQVTISGNQMWNNRDIEIDGLLSGAAITGNALGVNGGGGAINMLISGVGVQNIVWTGNIFYNTTGAGSTAVSATTCSNCSGSGNKTIGNTTLGTGTTAPGTLSSCNSGSTITNNLTNAVQAHLYGGTNVGSITHNGVQVWGGSAISLQAVTILMAPGDNFSVTTTAGTCPNTGFNAFNP